jgi:hypothetical protein
VCAPVVLLRPLTVPPDASNEINPEGAIQPGSLLPSVYTNGADPEIGIGFFPGIVVPVGVVIVGGVATAIHVFTVAITTVVAEKQLLLVS